MLRKAKLPQRIYLPYGLSIALIVVTGIAALAACQFPGSSMAAEATQTPVREITALTAYISGPLNVIDGCLVIGEKPGETVALAWVPNLQATIEGDTVRVKTGMVVGGTGEKILKIGETAYFSGGFVALDDDTRTTLSPDCPDPIFTVHGIAAPLKPQETETPRPTTPTTAPPLTPYP